MAGSGQLIILRPLTLAEVRDVVKIFEIFLFPAIEDAALAGWREGGPLGRELHVKVADVLFSSDARDEWRRGFPLEERLPVRILNHINIQFRNRVTFSYQQHDKQPLCLAEIVRKETHSEERLFFDFFSILFSRAQTSFRIPSQQLGTQKKAESQKVINDSNCVVICSTDICIFPSKSEFKNKNIAIELVRKCLRRIILTRRIMPIASVERNRG